MDDIDVGVDTIAAAKQVLKSMDLVLQTKQVRLNSGKTIILSQSEAVRHFRVLENAKLDLVRHRIEAKKRLNLNMRRERRLIELRLRRGLARRQFDEGNGEKILKRWIGLAGMVGARIRSDDLLRIFLLRPSVRETVCTYIGRTDLSVARSEMLANASESALLVDDAALVDLANNLVETTVTTTSQRHLNISRVIDACDSHTYFGLYCKLWLQSKYDNPASLMDTIISNRESWISHERLGRLVGAFRPLFVNSPEEPQFDRLLFEVHNDGFRNSLTFHIRLASDRAVFQSMYDALRNPNPSRGTGITHAKFLCLLSALRNQAASIAQLRTLKSNHAAAWRDVYYRRIARRLGI